MSDAESDSEVQFNIQANRNNSNRIRDDSVDEKSNYESQNEQENTEQLYMENVEVGVSSPRHTQSEPSATVPRAPRFQGSAAWIQSCSPAPTSSPRRQAREPFPRVDNPGRHQYSPTAGHPDQQSCNPDTNVGSPDRRSRALDRFTRHPEQPLRTSKRCNVPGWRQRSPEYYVASPELQDRFPNIFVHHSDRCPDGPRYYESETTGRSRVQKCYNYGIDRNSGGRNRYESPREVALETRRSFGRERLRPSPLRCAMSIPALPQTSPSISS